MKAPGYNSTHSPSGPSLMHVPDEEGDGAADGLELGVGDAEGVGDPGCDGPGDGDGGAETDAGCDGLAWLPRPDLCRPGAVTSWPDGLDPPSCGTCGVGRLRARSGGPAWASRGTVRVTNDMSTKTMAADTIKISGGRSSIG